MLASTSDCVRKMVTRSLMISASRRDALGDRRASRAPAAPTRSRIIVMSSCCGASPTNAAISRSTRSRSSSAGRCACSSMRSAQPLLAEAVVAGVHRLGDAVGEEHEQVALVRADIVSSLEQPLEHLAVVDLQAEHQAVRRQDARRSVRHRVPAGR